MAENMEIKSGDIVRLKSDTAENNRFTVGSPSGFGDNEIYIHWMYQGELKKSLINKDALHKIS